MNKKLYGMAIIGSMAFVTMASAHQGRTDSEGWHTCKTDCELFGLDTGVEHYHNEKDTTGAGYKRLIDPIAVTVITPAVTPQVETQTAASIIPERTVAEPNSTIEYPPYFKNSNMVTMTRYQISKLEERVAETESETEKRVHKKRTTSSSMRRDIQGRIRKKDAQTESTISHYTVSGNIKRNDKKLGTDRQTLVIKKLNEVTKENSLIQFPTQKMEVPAEVEFINISGEVPEGTLFMRIAVNGARPNVHRLPDVRSTWKFTVENKFNLIKEGENVIHVTAYGKDLEPIVRDSVKVVMAPPIEE